MINNMDHGGYNVNHHRLSHIQIMLKVDDKIPVTTHYQNKIEYIIVPECSQPYQHYQI